MKNKLFRYTFFVFVVLVVFALGYKIFSINSDIVDKAKWVDKVYNLRLINNNIDTIITRPTGFYNYDASKDLIFSLNDFFETLEQDSTIKEFLLAKQNQKIYAELKDKFSSKEHFIHVFTSTNSVLNHAIRFLTTIITEMPTSEYTNELIKIHSKIVLLGLGSETSIEDLKVLRDKIHNFLSQKYSYSIDLYLSHVDNLLIHYKKLKDLHVENEKLQIQQTIEKFGIHLKNYIHAQIIKLENVMQLLVGILLTLIVAILWILDDKIRQEVSLKTFRNAVEKSDNHIIITDVKHNIEFVNDTFLESSGFVESELLGKTPALIKSGLHPKEFYEELHATIASGKKWSGEFINKDKEGNLHYEKATISPIKDDKGNITHYIAIKLDVTSDKVHQKEIEEKNREIERRYYTDYLTNLQNRNSMMKKLDHKLAGRLYYININDFTQIKTFYGMKHTDNVIQKLSNVLENFIQEEQLLINSHLFRIKFDEFCLWNVDDAIPPYVLMQRLHNYIKNSEFIVDATPLDLDITIGASKDADFLNFKRFSEAEVAHHTARYKNLNYLVYSENNPIELHYASNIETLRIIQNALYDGRVTVFTQPIYSVDSNLIYMFEVLVRIVEPSGEVLTPYQFLEASKMTRYYQKIMRIVIGQTFELLKAHKEYKFSMNISYLDLSDEKTMGILFSELLACETPENLTFEILESENIIDYDDVKENIQKIKKFGCQIAIDDFGSGHSNFYRLTQLDVDYIKIDGSIIKSLDTDIFSQLIFESIVSFAKKANYPIVAEFVHKKEILDMLHEYRVEYAQGFYLAKPDKINTFF